METLRVTQGLLDARVTLQRLDDSRLVRGWITGVQSAQLRIRISEECIREGDHFAARTARLNGDVAFIAVARESPAQCAADKIKMARNVPRAMLLDFNERVYRFDVLGEMVPMPLSGDPRYICDPTRITVGGTEAELRDVSPAGCGVVTLSPMPAGSVVSVVAEVEERLVEVMAEVRYCRRVSTFPPLFRLGLRIQAEGRLEKARWLSVVKQRSARGYRARSLDKELPPVEPLPLPTPDETGIVWNVTARPQICKPKEAPKLPRDDNGELWPGADSII